MNIFDQLNSVIFAMAHKLH